MDLESIISRAAEVDAELADLAGLEELDEEQEARFDDLVAEVDVLAEKREKAEKRAASLEKARRLAEKPENEVKGDGARTLGIVDKTRSPYEVLDQPFASRADVRSAAMSAIDEVRDRDVQEERFLAEAYRKLEKKDDSRGTIGRLILATGSDAYFRAFAKYLAGGESRWTEEERQAISRAAEVRAMSLTDGDGGFAVPFPIDPTLIIANDGSANPFRQISRVETITTDSWQGISTIGGTASWDSEATEVSDDTPVWTQPKVTAHKAAAFVPASIEITQDYPNLVSDLTMVFMDEKDRLEAAAFATGAGDGSDQPFGIATAVGGTANAQSNYTAGSAFEVEDVYTAWADLGPKYRNRASWVMNQTTLNSVRQFGTSNNYHAFTVDLTQGTPSLLSRPVYEASEMDTDTDAAGTALNVNNIAVVGDFSNYLIADRVGMSVEFIPHLFSTSNNLPSGQRGWYAYWRVGADSINDAAFQAIVTSYSG